MVAWLSPARWRKRKADAWATRTRLLDRRAPEVPEGWPVNMQTWERAWRRSIARDAIGGILLVAGVLALFFWLSTLAMQQVSAHDENFPSEMVRPAVIRVTASLVLILLSALLFDAVETIARRSSRVVVQCLQVAFLFVSAVIFIAAGQKFFPSSVWLVLGVSFGVLFPTMLVAYVLARPLDHLVAGLIPTDVRAFATSSIHEAFETVVRMQPDAGGTGLEPLSWSSSDDRARLARLLSSSSQALLGARVRPLPRPASPAVRESLRDYQRRVAAGFAALASEVTLGAADRFDDVRDSVLSGYTAVRLERWGDLSGADATQVRKARMRTMVERLLTVAVLTAAALWGIPAVEVLDGDAAKTAQGVLLAGAVYALTDPRQAYSAIRDRVASSLSSM